MKTILKPGLIACMLLAGGVSLFAAFANDAVRGKRPGRLSRRKISLHTRKFSKNVLLRKNYLPTF